MIRPDRLGHLVIKVRDLARSERFYSEVLGLQVTGRIPEWGLVFLSAGGRDHHELALMSVGMEAKNAASVQVGLLHFAFRLRNEEELRAAYTELKDLAIPIHATVNHGIAKGVYFHDPDGNEVELYCDGDPSEYSKWRNPFGGSAKLDFAKEDPGLADVAPIFMAQTDTV